MYFFQKWYSVEILSVYLLAVPSTYSRAHIHANHGFLKQNGRTMACVISLAPCCLRTRAVCCVIPYLQLSPEIVWVISLLAPPEEPQGAEAGLNGWAVSLYYYTSASSVCSPASVTSRDSPYMSRSSLLIFEMLWNFLNSVSVVECWEGGGDLSTLLCKADISQPK